MEHRCYARRHIDSDITIIDKIHGSVRGKIKDISLSGLYIEANNKNLKPNSIVKLIIAINKKPTKAIYFLSGFIVRTTIQGVAIMLTEYNQDYLNTIREQFEISRTGSVIHSTQTA